MYYFKFKGSGAKEISRLEYEELIKKKLKMPKKENI
jgi:hypothetical protein